MKDKYLGLKPDTYYQACIESNVNVAKAIMIVLAIVAFTTGLIIGLNL